MDPKPRIPVQSYTVDAEFITVTVYNNEQGMSEKETAGPVDRLQNTKSVDVEEFDSRVQQEATIVKDHLDKGTFDNEQTTVGFEYEFYAVDRRSHELRRVPRQLLNCLGFDRELGLHNTELNCNPQPLNAAGLDALRQDVEAKVRAFQRRATDEQLRIVSDGMWTIGPAQSPIGEYLTEANHEEGLTLAINVANAVRYHGFGSIDGSKTINGRIDVDGVTIEADNASPVSLTSSIQPHYQCRRAANLPSHMQTALRIAGPLLAVGVNSPLFPPELYDEELPVGTKSGDLHRELRIPVYEQMMNPQSGEAKVRFPADIDTPSEAVDRIATDTTIVPADIDAGQRFDDQFVHFKHKHGSYWRWVRPVFDGASKETASARIEFRPLPGQPTIRDSLAFTATFTGLLTSMHATDHPARTLDWETAKENFYAATRDGLDANLIWRTTDGGQTTDTDELFSDLFDVAVDGLVRHGMPEDDAETRIAPLRDRVQQGRTPASWKLSAATAACERGESPAEALRTAQKRYIDQQSETLYTGHLTDWTEP
jgi:gamma-glutamyl:cysteine ligase YbdK (ATP-grasp superfamily)